MSKRSTEQKALELLLKHHDQQVRLAALDALQAAAHDDDASLMKRIAACLALDSEMHAVDPGVVPLEVRADIARASIGGLAACRPDVIARLETLPDELIASALEATPRGRPAAGSTGRIEAYRALFERLGLQPQSRDALRKLLERSRSLADARNVLIQK